MKSFNSWFWPACTLELQRCSALEVNLQNYFICQVFFFSQKVHVFVQTPQWTTSLNHLFLPFLCFLSFSGLQNLLEVRTCEKKAPNSRFSAGTCVSLQTMTLSIRLLCENFSSSCSFSLSFMWLLGRKTLHIQYENHQNCWNNVCSLFILYSER